MKYFLICIAPDGDYVHEGTYNTIEAAWDRCNDMGSRWFFYPLRVVVDEDDKVVSTDDNTPDIEPPMLLTDFISKFTE